MPLRHPLQKLTGVGEALITALSKLDQRVECNTGSTGLFRRDAAGNVLWQQMVIQMRQLRMCTADVPGSHDACKPAIDAALKNVIKVPECP